MTTPDRFQRMVERVPFSKKNGSDYELAKLAPQQREKIATLLRREHAAIRRKVKEMKNATGTYGQLVNSAAYIVACDDLLTWLDRRR